MGHSIVEAAERLNQRLADKINTGLSLHKDLHKHHLHNLLQTGNVPAHYSIADDDMFDVESMNTSGYDVPRPSFLPQVFPDAGSEYPANLPVPEDGSELEYEDANEGANEDPNEGEMEIYEPPPPSMIDLAKDAALNTAKYMGTNLKNNLIGTAHLAKNAAVAASHETSGLGPMVAS